MYPVNQALMKCNATQTERKLKLESEVSNATEESDHGWCTTEEDETDSR